MGCAGGCRFGEQFASSPHHDRWLEDPASMAFYHISVLFVPCFGLIRVYPALRGYVRGSRGFLADR